MYYQDTDAGGIVYHSRYLDFLERGRADWLRHLGFSSTQLLENHGVALVVREARINFHRPARLDDLIVISVDEINFKYAHLTLTQAIKKNGLILVSADVNLACVRLGDLKPMKFPDSLKEVLQNRA